MATRQLLSSLSQKRLKIQPATKCIDFSATTDEVDVGSDFLGTGNISISAWIKPRSAGASNNGRIITNGKIIYRMSTNKQLHFSSDASVTATTSATNSINFNKWQFITVTRTSAGIVNHYINGVLSGTANQNSGTPAAGTTNTLIGNNNLQNRNYDGMIANLVVHNKILSQQEISDLYYSGLPATGGLNNSLLANYTFDNTLKDSSGNGHDGTATGTTFSYDVRDVARTAVSANTRLSVRDFGTSINLDGVNGSRVTLSSVLSQLDHTKSFTFSLWCKPNVAYSGNLFTQYDSTINSLFVAGLQSNQIRVKLKNLSGAVDVGPTSSGNFPIPKNKWSHIVYTWDTLSAKLYINNSLQEGTTPNTNTSATDHVAHVGARNNGQNVWNGKIDQIRIFSKALSSQEVNDLFIKGDYPTASITNQYLFDENTGITANDSIGNNDGTLTGGATWSTDVPMLARQSV